MPFEHADEAQRLTEHYSQMYDGELENLAADLTDLTDVAQQVLRDEIKKRGLDATLKQEPRPAQPSDPFLSRRTEGGPELPADRPDGEDGPREFTWKTYLCECEGQEQAWQLREALSRAGIDCWIEQLGARSAGPGRVLVAADDLDNARKVVAQPIPQDIVDESRTQIPAYEMPTCPDCGAADPVLEDVEGGNCWSCEACGSRWTDPVEASGRENG